MLISMWKKCTSNVGYGDAHVVLNADCHVATNVVHAVLLASPLLPQVLEKKKKQPSHEVTIKYFV